MAKTVNNYVLDAVCDYLKSNGNRLTLCEGEPTTYEHANSAKGTGTGKMLAYVALDTGDYTADDGDVSGRKTTISAQNSISVVQSGTGSHVAIVDTVNERVLYVTTCESVVVLSGLVVSIGAWDIEIADPS